MGVRKVAGLKKLYVKKLYIKKIIYCILGHLVSPKYVYKAKI